MSTQDHSYDHDDAESLERALEIHDAIYQVPLGRAKRTGVLSHAGLRRLYGRFDKTALAIFVLASPTLSALWWLAFRLLAQIGQPDVGLEGLLARANGDFLMFPAVWAGLISAYGFSRLAMSRILGRRYPAYWVYRRLGLGFNGPRVVGITALVTAGLTAIILYGLASNYTAFTRDRIIIQSWQADAISYPYSEIAAIRSVTATEQAPAHYEIEFYGGGLWRSDGGLRKPNAYLDHRYVALAAQLSGQEITGPNIAAP